MEIGARSFSTTDFAAYGEEGVGLRSWTFTWLFAWSSWEYGFVVVGKMVEDFAEREADVCCWTEMGRKLESGGGRILECYLQHGSVKW